MDDQELRRWAVEQLVMGGFCSSPGHLRHEAGELAKWVSSGPELRLEDIYRPVRNAVDPAP